MRSGKKRPGWRSGDQGGPPIATRRLLTKTAPFTCRTEPSVSGCLPIIQEKKRWRLAPDAKIETPPVRFMLAETAAAVLAARLRRDPGWHAKGSCAVMQEVAAGVDFSPAEGACMMTLRCTRKLLAKLGIDRAGEPGPATARLGDWYGTFLHTRPAHLVVLTSEASLLTLVLEGRELDTLVPRFLRRLVEMLAEIGVPQEAIDAELARMSPMAFGPTISRRTLGVLNQACADLRVMLPLEPDFTIYDWSWRLSRTPWSPIRFERQEDIVRRLLGAPPRLRLVGPPRSPLN